MYVRICSAGSLFIVAYNVLGSIFRGIGDSRMPLITVAIACVFNIAGDFLLVGVFGLATAGAAIATVCSPGSQCGYFHPDNTEEEASLFFRQEGYCFR